MAISSRPANGEEKGTNLAELEADAVAAAEAAAL